MNNTTQNWEYCHSEDEYQKEVRRIQASFCPAIYACSTCGHAVADGYACKTCGSGSPKEHVPE